MHCPVTLCITAGHAGQWGRSGTFVWFRRWPLLGIWCAGGTRVHPCSAGEGYLRTGPAWRTGRGWCRGPSGWWL